MVKDGKDEEDGKDGEDGKKGNDGKDGAGRKVILEERKSLRVYMNN